MARRIGVCAAAVCAALAIPAAPGPIRTARADTSELLGQLELSGFFGAHVFSDNSSLGATGAASIASSVVFSPRLTYFLTERLAVEGELPLALSSARDADVNVVVVGPRVQARFDTRAVASLLPFVTVGAGAPVSLSGNGNVIGNDISGELFAGGGVMLLRQRTWNLRLDARLAAVPARGSGLFTAEFEVGVGLYRSLSSAPGASRARAERLEWADSDGDGVADGSDRCPDRDEDVDGYDDDDGCPDIDNDFDQVLDIADSCPLRPEAHNGFEDDDGCPDAVPREVLAIVGRIDRLAFGTRSARIDGSGRRALRKIAAVMKKHGSVRVTVIGYTDADEAARAGEALSLERARAVRDYLVQQGVRAWRVKVAGAGAENPVASNDSRRGRRKNRRAEIHLRVYVVKQAPLALPGT